MTHSIFESVGLRVLSLARKLGAVAMMLKSIGVWLFRTAPESREVVRQSVRIGVDSLSVTILTSFFTGMVLALQMGYTSKNWFNEPLYIGTMVAFSLVKELAPVLTSIVVSGRVGAAITAEIGTMKVTEQLDALYTLGTNPTRYLLIPRYIAFMITLPILIIFAVFTGILGGFLVSSIKLGVPSSIYWNDIFTFMDINNFMHGFLKSFAFAFMIATVSCYKGLHCEEGSEGVGKATTEAVVMSMVLVLVLDYFVSAMLVTVGII